MKCTQCFTNEATRGLLCESCVNSNRGSHAEFQQRINAASHSAYNGRQSFISESLVKFGIGGFLVLIGGLYVFGFFPKGNISSSELARATGSIDRCQFKERCMLVYMTPWCPACKATLPFVQALHRYSMSRNDLGVQLYVGGDSSENINSMIARSGLPAVADLSRKAGMQIPGRSVPRWAVIDKEGDIVSNGAGLPAINSESSSYFTQFVQNKIFD